MTEFNRINLSSAEVQSFIDYSDSVTVPVSLEMAGLTLEQVQRASGRGLVIHSIYRLPESDNIITTYEFIKGTPAMNMAISLKDMTDEEAAETGNSFRRDALLEEDDERFRLRWIQYY